MTNIFFFETPSEAVGHGVGTYAYNLLTGLKNIEADVKLIYVSIKFAEHSSYHSNVLSIRQTNIDIVFKKQRIQETQETDISLNMARTILALLSDLLHPLDKVVFHLNTVRQHSLAEIAKEYDFKVVYTNHVSLWRVFYENDKSKFLADWNDEEKDKKNNRFYLSMKVEKNLCKIADDIISLTYDNKKFMETHYDLQENNKVNLIRNGLIVKKEKTILNKEALRKQLGYVKEDFIFLFLGRLTRQKGLDILLDCFSKYIKTQSNVKLLVVGKGDIEYYAGLCADFCGKVSFTGYISNSEIQKYYAIADIGILPSMTEQCSFVALEMLSSNLPMIVSDIPAFEKPFEDKINIIKVKTDILGRVDEKNLAIQMLNLYQNPELRNKLSKNGKALFEEHFTARHMAEKTIQLYLS